MEKKEKRSDAFQFIVSIVLCLAIILLLSYCSYEYDVMYEKGRKTGYEEGYQEGESDGYEKGYESGYEEGYNDGYDDCEYYYE